MNTDFILPYIIIFVILFGLTLPVNFIIFRTVIEIVKFFKSLLAEEESVRIIEKCQREELERRLKAQEEKQRIGYFHYYMRAIRIRLKKYGYILYVLLLLAVLVVAYVPLQNKEFMLPAIQIPEWVGFVFFPVLLFLTAGYLLAKTEKTKWQLQFATVIYIGVRILWGIIVEKTMVRIGFLGWFVVALLLCISHYSRWIAEHEKRVETLNERLQEEGYSSDLFVSQYQALLAQRPDHKMHFLYYLNEEKQIDAMQDYLDQLDREQTAQYAT